jgi:hypothetical protein
MGLAEGFGLGSGFRWRGRGRRKAFGFGDDVDGVAGGAVEIVLVVIVAGAGMAAVGEALDDGGLALAAGLAGGGDFGAAELAERGGGKRVLSLEA